MSDDYRAEARRAAKAAGIDPDVFERQIHQESGFNPNARSPAGARGIAQFMPETARGLGINPDNPVEALHGAAKLMASYERKYGNAHDALVAYNAGPGRVGGKLPAETENYIKVILGSGGGKARVPGKTATPSAPSAPAPATGQNAASARRAALQAYVLAQGTSDQPDSVLNLARSLTAAKNAPDAKTALRTRRTTRAPAPGSGQSPHAAPGDPVVSSKQSTGGVHETAGLAGFPARDYFAPAGTHAVAPVAGTVVRLSGHDPKNGPTEGPHGPLGWSVYIKGSDGKTYFLTHMGSRNVQPGQKVKQGQVIGTVADYDKYGTPSHIHMGVNG